MWKRENEPVSSLTPGAPAAPSPAAAPRREPEPAPPTPRASEPSSPSTPSGRASIGAATTVRGEISGEEDLLVEGRVEGKIDLRQNAVTVGAKGRLAADVFARAILVDGEVDGNLTAEEQIVIRRSGRVRGDLTAPRVTIEDGARFKGSIDMDPKRVVAAAQSVAPSPRPAVAAPKAADPVPAALAAVVGKS